MLIPWKFHGAPCYLTTHLWRKYRWESNIPSCPVISSHIHSPEPTQQFPHLATTLVSRTIATPLVSRTAAATHQLDNKLRHEIRHIPPFRWLLGIFYSLVSSRGDTRAKLTSVVCESLEASRVVGPIIITMFNCWLVWIGLPNPACSAGMGVPANCLFSVQLAEINDTLNRGLYHPLIYWCKNSQWRRLLLGLRYRLLLLLLKKLKKLFW